jgi:phenylacetic acid degradation operon negative regulatory protein
MDISPRHLILSLYGLYARAEANWLSVASLIALMADLGVDSSAVRASVSRLKKRGVLEAERREGQAGYGLAPATLALLREGDHRIWSRPRATTADGWLVVVFSVPESRRDQRHALRSQLARLGFGTAAPGVWIAPGTLYGETLAVLERQDLASYTEFFRGDYLGVGEVGRRVGEWWDLETIAEEYEAFLAEVELVGTRRSGVGRPADEDAFAAYVPMLTSWRRLPYLDPGLPLEVLPKDWPGIEAASAFATRDRRLRRGAERHARRVLRG